MVGRIFGEIPGVIAGTAFATRQEASEAGVHRPTVAGISGTPAEGADSIVISGGYEDDEDDGDLIIYTGHGGNDPTTKKQIADQLLTKGNLALAVSCDEGLPVRVIRGAKSASPFAPAVGYRYDGLYRVDSYWSEQGRSGYRIWRFRLERLSDPLSTAPQLNSEPGTSTPERRLVSVQRVVRNTLVAQRVKELHGYRCQVCGTTLDTPAGPYIEAAHIRPLGRPHDGPDTLNNILSLCPNHHVLLDMGVLEITDAFEVRDRLTGNSLGKLRQAPEHQIDLGALSYRRKLFGA